MDGVLAVLRGPDVVYELESERVVIGRGETCDVQLQVSVCVDRLWCCALLCMISCMVDCQYV